MLGRPGGHIQESALGAERYPALVKLCQQNLAKEANLINRLEQSEKHAESQSLFDAVLEHEKSNLLRTYARIEDADWSRAVDQLSQAPRIYVMGLRKCSAIAQLLTYLLHLVRPGVEQIAPATGVIIDQLRDLDPDGVFVAMSIRRYTADTVRALKHAKDSGLRTIALTDDPSSPLARLVETTFYIDAEGVRPHAQRVRVELSHSLISRRQDVVLGSFQFQPVQSLAFRDGRPSR